MSIYRYRYMYVYRSIYYASLSLLLSLPPLPRTTPLCLGSTRRYVSPQMRQRDPAALWCPPLVSPPQTPFPARYHVCKGALQCEVSLRFEIRPVYIHERVSTESFVVLRIRNSKSKQLDAPGTCGTLRFSRSCPPPVFRRGRGPARPCRPRERR